MSDAVFPTLPGLSWGIIKTPTFSTKIQKAVTGRETRISYMPAPMVKFSLPYEFLRDKMTQQNPSGVYAELRQLMGFYLARQGSFDSFIYDDPTDNTATNQNIGLGDGSTKSFQLVRSFGSQFGEAVENINGTPTIYVNNVATAVTIGSTGIVTFASAPSAGAALSWTGQYYYRCRFDSDSYDFEQMMQDMWSLSSIELYGALQNRV